MTHLPKFLLLLIVCSLLSSQSLVYSQQPQTLAVTYEYYQQTKSGNPVYLMSFADSTNEFIFFARDSINKHILDMQQRIIYGHSTYFVRANNIKYEAANYKYGQFLVKLPNNDLVYNKTENKKWILGYHCTKYLCTTTKGDKIEAWSTDSIGNFYSKIFAPGAPGVVLEMKWYLKNIDEELFYKAIALNLVNSSVIFPDTEMILTEDGSKKYNTGCCKLSKLNINPNAIINPKKNKLYPKRINW